MEEEDPVLQTIHHEMEASILETGRPLLVDHDEVDHPILFEDSLAPQRLDDPL